MPQNLKFQIFKHLLKTTFVSLLFATCKSEPIKSKRVAVTSPQNKYFLLLQDCAFSASTLASETKVCSEKKGKDFQAVLLSQEGSFYRVNLPSGAVATCQLSMVYIPITCVNVSDKQTETKPIVVSSQPEAVKITPSKAFLNVIAYAEGTPKYGNEDGYNVMFGGKLFSSYADHPRKIQQNRSDAAGRYQFLARTWDDIKKKKNLSNFEPKNQDSGGLGLVENRGVRNYSVRLGKSEYRTAIGLLGKEWASLPGSPYGQPIKSFDELWGVYENQFK